MKWSMLLLIFLFAGIAIAANDPGHDTLYIEETGDSALTGDLNISDEFRVENLWYSSNLHLVGNGTVLSAPSQPRIMGGSSALYLDSTGNLYINTKGGTSSVVQIGDTSTNAISVNISGNTTLSHNFYITSGGITIADTVRLSNAGVGTFASATTIGGQSVCLADGTNCQGGGASSSGGWQNDSNLVHLWSNSTNVSMGNTTGSMPLLFVDTENEKVGIGTEFPSEALSVVGSIENTYNASSTPSLLSTFSEGTSKLGGDFSWPYLYTFATGGVIEIVDMTDPVNPALVSSEDIGSASEIIVSGRYAYVAEPTTDLLHVVDISNPGNIDRLGNASLGSSAITAIDAIEISGKYAYVFSTDGGGTGHWYLDTFDVSDPSNPFSVSALDLDEGFAVDIKIQGKYMYALYGKLDGGFELHSYVRVYDISDPTSPSVIKTIDYTGADSDQAGIAMDVAGKYLYILHDFGSEAIVIIYNISDSETSINQVGNITFSETLFSGDIAVRGKYVYAALGDELRIIDVTNPASPIVEISYDWGSGNIKNFDISGRYSYIITGSVLVLDLLGLETTAAQIYSLEAGEIQVHNDIFARGTITADTGITTGSQGIYSAGDIATSGNAYVNGTLNVTGAIYESNKRVCLADGTNCQAGGAGSSGGWQNDSTLVHLYSNITNVSIGNTTGNLPILFVDTENERVGIGTTPNYELDVVGTVNTTAARINTNLSYINPTTNSTKEVWFDTNGKKVAERYWNGTALVLNVTG